MGGGEVIRYLTRHGARRVEQIALVAATAPFPMATADNPVAIDRMLIEVALAVRTADRPRWFADNADAEAFSSPDSRPICAPGCVQSLGQKRVCRPSSQSSQSERAKIMADEKTLLDNLCAYRAVLCFPNKTH